MILDNTIWNFEYLKKLFLLMTTYVYQTLVRLHHDRMNEVKMLGLLRNDDEVKRGRTIKTCVLQDDFENCYYPKTTFCALHWPVVVNLLLLVMKPSLKSHDLLINNDLRN